MSALELSPACIFVRSPLSFTVTAGSWAGLVPSSSIPRGPATCRALSARWPGPPPHPCFLLQEIPGIASDTCLKREVAVQVGYSAAPTLGTGETRQAEAGSARDGGCGWLPSKPPFWVNKGR